MLLVVTEVVLLSIVDFETLDISQGSVATHLRCGGIFSDSINCIITNFLLILTVSNFENRLVFGKVKADKEVVPILGHPVQYIKVDVWLLTLGSLHHVTAINDNTF